MYVPIIFRPLRGARNIRNHACARALLPDASGFKGPQILNRFLGKSGWNEITRSPLTGLLEQVSDLRNLKFWPGLKLLKASRIF